MVYDMNDSNIC